MTGRVQLAIICILTALFITCSQRKVLEIPSGPASIQTANKSIPILSGTAYRNAPYNKNKMRIDLSNKNRTHPCRVKRVVREWQISLLHPLPFDTGIYRIGESDLTASILNYRDGSRDNDCYEVNEGFVSVSSIDTVAGFIEGTLHLKTDSPYVWARGSFRADFCGFEPDHKFLSRPLQGSIEGQNYEYSGAVFEEFYNEYALYPHSFRIYFFDEKEPNCNEEERPGVRISVDMKLDQKIYPDRQKQHPMVVEILSQKIAYICQYGTVKITGYDSINGRISGRVDAFFNDTIQINGHFSAERCR